MSQLSNILSDEMYEDITKDPNLNEILYSSDLVHVDSEINDSCIAVDPANDFVSIGRDISQIPFFVEGECETIPIAYGGPAQMIRQIPANEEYPGEYDFNFKLSNGPSGKKSWEFSQELNKVYIDMGAKLSVEFKWTPPNEWLYVRATPRFSEPQHADESVRRCITHSNDKHPTNRDCSLDMLPHVIRCYNEGSEYVTTDKELSVRTPLGSPQRGVERVTLLYSFMCKNSCTSGMNRRPIQVVYTLEDANGVVLGRRKHDVRICSCPKRDREKDESVNGAEKHPPGKKRKVGAGNGQKTTSRVKEEPPSLETVWMPQFRVVGQENKRKILNYAYNLLAGEARRFQVQEPYESVIDEIESLIDRTN